MLEKKISSLLTEKSIKGCKTQGRQPLKKSILLSALLPKVEALPGVVGFYLGVHLLSPRACLRCGVSCVLQTFGSAHCKGSTDLASTAPSESPLPTEYGINHL